MNCPICQQRLFAIGEEGFYSPLGFACPTKIEMAIAPTTEISARNNDCDWTCHISHYEIRGARVIISLPENYQVINWNNSIDDSWYSTVSHFVRGKGYQKVFECRELPIESEEKFLTRIKMLAVFS